jgi:hypothetical protein
MIDCVPDRLEHVVKTVPGVEVINFKDKKTIDALKYGPPQQLSSATPVKMDIVKHFHYGSTMFV